MPPRASPKYVATCSAAEQGLSLLFVASAIRPRKGRTSTRITPCPSTAYWPSLARPAQFPNGVRRAALPSEISLDIYSAKLPQHFAAQRKSQYAATCNGAERGSFLGLWGVNKPPQ